jgi:hypothetical protein
MAQYDNAADVINAAANECGITSVSDPYGSSATEFVQLRGLLTQCGRELLAMYQWEELVVRTSFSTTATPPANGQFALPADFGYFINQTGWTPVSSGFGVPLIGPLSEQVWAAVLASGLSSTTLYIAFKIAQRKINVLPAPPPANITIGYAYMSRYWVQDLASGLPSKDAPTLSTDTILYESILISKMLALRYKQAKGLDANSALEQFTAMYATYTGVNAPSPILSLNTVKAFPFLNMWSNVPPTGYGS